MRLIDADKLEAKLQEYHNFFVNAYGGFKNLPPNDKARVDEITHCISEVVNAPTIEPETKVVANVTFNKEQVEELVEKAKADILAQIERPQGEWIENTDKLGLSYICSFCGHEITGIPQDLNYCCKCGAKQGFKR